MDVVVNGRERRLEDGATVAALLREMDLDDRPVAVEVNRRIVRRGEFERTALRDGDRIEIVTFVGGG